MRIRRTTSTLASALAGLALVATATLVPAVGASASAAPAGSATTGVQITAKDSGWTARGEDYPKTTLVTDVPIEMSDGTVLRGDVNFPADSNGKRIEKKFPVVVTITAYNKSFQAYAGGLAGGNPGYLVKRGYIHVTVDARGTGSSEGTWEAFAARENQDAGEIMTWAHEQPWSTGSTAMTGPSYMGISQLWAASAQPPGLKALFPQVPGADVYRDVVASGGQIDVGFIPLWMGLVTATGIIPPAVTASDPRAGISVLLSHVGGALNFTVPLMLQALLGGDPSVDGDFYDERSVINVIDRVTVPTFFIGGEHDLFQRGTPLLFENLQQRGVPTKMIFGPWDHLQGSAGDLVADAGEGTLAELQLRWFDHYVKGMPDPALDTDIAPLTYYEQGSGAWRTSDQWIGDHLSATSYRLAGTSSMGGKAGGLTTGAVQAGTSSLLPLPVSGLCTRSMNQWTAGLPQQTGLLTACLENNALNDLSGLAFETAPMTEALAFQGPINVRLHVSSTSGDGMLSVAVEDVAPDGTVSRLTGGWQVISFRELDESRSRYLDGHLIQPFHPFTRESKRPLGKGEIAPVDVEVFPTGARIQPGHKLRIAVQGFDIPHLLSPLGDLLATTATVMTIHNTAEHPSLVTLPTLPAAKANPKRAPATQQPKPAKQPDALQEMLNQLLASLGSKR
ncbi:CocE/NonD family hydrolase [Nocardioides sp. AE5]|uniref:CocE/NonD family hydrolase n=1 Tax=Nocardioides sp. AE5 TaxID=2962573 RepID=UPI00288167AB|nr:CocE/NonD family hydrolase [Nocardioides sp. AE5]MDT0203483.1 CocE/NonD family hydrolase [Nocardioides sp. AE5]